MRNKGAQLLAALAAADYPGEWPEFVEAALAAAARGAGTDTVPPCPSSADAFVRLLTALDDDVIALDVPRTAAGAAAGAALKDALRGAPLSALVGGVCRVAAAAAPARPSLSAAALSMVGRLAAWGDIGTVASGGVVALLFGALDAPRARAAPAAAAAGALAAIAAKRMEAPSKLALLADSGLAARAAAWAAAAAAHSAGTPPQAPAPPRRARGAAVRLLAVVAGEVLDAWKRVEGGVAGLASCGLEVPPDAAADAAAACAAAEALLDGLLPPLVAALPALAHCTTSHGRAASCSASEASSFNGDAGGGQVDGDADDDDAADAGSYAAVAFLTAYIARLRALAKRAGDGGLPLGAGRHVASILTAAADAARWPPSAPPAHPSPADADAEDAASERRAELFALVRAAASLDADGAAAAVARGLDTVLQPRSPPPPFHEVEIAIACLYHLGEGAPDASVRPAGALGAAARTLAAAGCRVPHATHRLVAASLFECHARYARAIGADDAALGAAAAAFLSDAGAAHADARVAARASYLFARFARTLRQPLLARLPTLLPALKPLLDDVVQGAGERAVGRGGRAAEAAAAGHGSSSAPREKSDDRLYLFEAAGLLLGQAELDPAAQLDAVHALVDPPLAALAAALPAAAAAGGGPATVAAAATVRTALDALARSARGFSPSLALRVRPAVGAALAPAADAAVAVLTRARGGAGAPPGRRALRARAASLLHRLVDTLGPALLPLLPAAARALLPSPPSPCDVVDAAALLAQLAAAYGGDAAPLMAAVLPDVASAAASVLPPDHDWTGAAAAPRRLDNGGGGGGGAIPSSSTDVPPPPSEEARERGAVQRALLALTHALASARLGAVALAAASGLLDVLLASASAHVDPAVRRACVQSVRRLVADAAAATPPSPSLPPFLRDAVVRRVCLTGLASSRLDARDGAVAALVGDVAALLVDATAAARALAAAGVETATPIDVATDAAAAGFPPAVAAAVAAAVDAGDAKAARGALRGGLLELAGVAAASSAAAARARVAARAAAAAGGVRD